MAVRSKDCPMAIVAVRYGCQIICVPYDTVRYCGLLDMAVRSKDCPMAIVAVRYGCHMAVRS